MDEEIRWRFFRDSLVTDKWYLIPDSLWDKILKLLDQMDDNTPINEIDEIEAEYLYILNDYEIANPRAYTFTNPRKDG